jgi:serine/threonine-protein kinase
LGFEGATVMATRAAGGEAVVAQRAAYFPHYVLGGYLTYISGGTLFAVPFDPERLTIDGVPAPVAEQVRTNPQTGGTQLAVSSRGTLAYAVSDDGAATAGAPMMWLDAQGLRPLREMPAVWGNPRFSPDGRRIAMTINDGRQLDVWVYDWERGALTRITSDSANDAVPVWTADGRHVIFGSNRDPSGRYSLYWQPADGTGAASRLTDGVRSALPDDVDASGRFLAYHDGDPSQGQRIMVLSLEGLGTSGWTPPSPREVIGSSIIAAVPEFSSDGRWLAYSSNESGRFEIYVLPFPGPGPRVQVSSDGGNVPRWSPTRSELYYVAGGLQRVMRVPFTVEAGTFVPSKAEAWGDTQFSATTPFATFGPGFDLHPDGRRFVVAPPAEPSTDPIGPDHLVFVSNAFNQVQRTRARPQ